MRAVRLMALLLPGMERPDKWDDGRPQAGQRYERYPVLLTEAGTMWPQVRFIRSCNRRGAPVWAAEFQGGPVSTGLHKGVCPRGGYPRWMLTAVSTGSLPSASGSLAPRSCPRSTASACSIAPATARRVSRSFPVGSALNRHAELFGQPSWVGRVGILSMSELPILPISHPRGEHLPYSVRGWHRLLWDAPSPWISSR